MSRSAGALQRASVCPQHSTKCAPACRTSRACTGSSLSASCSPCRRGSLWTSRKAASRCAWRRRRPWAQRRDPLLGFVVQACTGHLFSYQHACLACDSMPQQVPLLTPGHGIAQASFMHGASGCQGSNCILASSCVQLSSEHLQHIAIMTRYRLLVTELQSLHGHQQGHWQLVQPIGHRFCKCVGVCAHIRSASRGRSEVGLRCQAFACRA